MVVAAVACRFAGPLPNACSVSDRLAPPVTALRGTSVAWTLSALCGWPRAWSRHYRMLTPWCGGWNGRDMGFFDDVPRHDDSLRGRQGRLWEPAVAEFRVPSPPAR
jgi:hypothetical protein